ncbi:NADPH oxidase 5-like [Corticium candelabrum]|uniref:NADPH oxidase 5-like n=1 Tax=Corticium candelabrum TaxID=121492 RepID=UPI002E277477|nr:NADPH oxidase 5-like [Corticium candelabrum]
MAQFVGRVVGTKMTRTAKVCVNRLALHPLVKKIVSYMLRNSASSSSTSVRIVALVELPLFAHVSCDDVCVGMEPGCVALCSVSAIVHVPQQGIPPMILDNLQICRLVEEKWISHFFVRHHACQCKPGALTRVCRTVLEFKKQHMEDRSADEKWLACLNRKLAAVASSDGLVGLDEFRNVLALKDDFIAERFFQLFDKSEDGFLSTKELIDGISLLTQGSKLDKLRFLFEVYDVDGNGYIDPEELRIVLESCMGESALKLSDEQLDDLTNALFGDMDADESGTITFEELKAQLDRNPSLVENLTVSVPEWLSPQPFKARRIFANFSCARYIKNNMSTVVTTVLFTVINIGLFTYNAIAYKHSGPAVSIARGFGLCLDFDTVTVIVLMLRKTLTWLRGTSLGPYLPLDQHINLHKVVAYVILMLAIGHTTAHCVNIRQIVNEPNATHAYWEYLFSTHTDLGWVNGSAGVTGVTLLIILITIVICSQPFVRQTGHFEIFYCTHMLFVGFYVVLIIHAEMYWKWFIVPGTIYAVERVLRSKAVNLVRYGRTYIVQGNCLPSKVTHLVISRPAGFTFQPGDYIFLQIPAVAKYEWHPFTISSCPEQTDVIWVHVRSAGTWTTKVYEYFASTLEKARQRDMFIRAAVQRVGSGVSDHRRLSMRLKQQYQKRLSKPSTDVEARCTSVCEAWQDNVRFTKQKKQSLECYIDGPYGTPSTHIFQAEHAVLVAAGIGVTPFASILQSIAKHHENEKVQCPNCMHKFCRQNPQSVMKLRKVDFYWINRDQRAFEWFISLLTQLEVEQSTDSSYFQQFLEMHMYMTSALKKEDVKVICLQVAIDLLHKNTHQDVITGLKTRTEAGRPDWNKVFAKIKAEGKGRVTVFFCGPAALGKVLRSKCDEYKFGFRKENF